MVLEQKKMLENEKFIILKMYGFVLDHQVSKRSIKYEMIDDIQILDAVYVYRIQTIRLNSKVQLNQVVDGMVETKTFFLLFTFIMIEIRSFKYTSVV